MDHLSVTAIILAACAVAAVVAVVVAIMAPTPIQTYAIDGQLSITITEDQHRLKMGSFTARVTEKHTTLIPMMVGKVMIPQQHITYSELPSATVMITHRNDIVVSLPESITGRVELWERERR